jgi:sec-independent protein translocase protein TatA
VIGDILQPTHLIFVLVVALLVLGPKRLPEVGRSLGRGLRDFRSALSSDEHDEVPAESPHMNLSPAEPAHQPAPAQPAEPATQAAEPAAQQPEPAQTDAAEQPEHVA